MDISKAEAGWAALAFHDESQHDLAALANIDRVLRMNVIDTEIAISFGQKLLQHVHPAAHDYLEQLKIRLDNPQMEKFCGIGQRAWINMRANFRFEQLSEKQRKLFYTREGSIFVRKPDATKLLVVFTTIHNAFYWSNAALIGMLGKLDCSILLVRDPSMAQYHLGVKNFAYGARQLGPAITRLAQKEGLEQTYIAAYSSAVGLALWLSLQIECHGFLGFSGFTQSTLLPHPDQAVRQQTLSHLTDLEPVDLKPLLAKADPDVKRTFYYGDLSPDDTAQAGHIAELNTVEIIRVTGCGHTTPLYLAGDGKFRPAFKKLLSDA